MKIFGPSRLSAPGEPSGTPYQLSFADRSSIQLSLAAKSKTFTCVRLFSWPKWKKVRIWALGYRRIFANGNCLTFVSLAYIKKISFEHNQLKELVTHGNRYEYWHDVMSTSREISFQKLWYYKAWMVGSCHYICQTHSASHVLCTSFEDIKTKEKMRFPAVDQVFSQQDSALHVTDISNNITYKSS